MSGSAVLGEVSPIREGVVVAAVDGALDASDWRVAAVVLRRRREPGYYGCNSAVFDAHEVSQPE